tara:strand:+ start:2090 stop:2401 length:312 start_codon:yes stop_codon:yes gene_type:complete
MKLTAEKLKQMITESLNEQQQPTVYITDDKVLGAFGSIKSGQFPHHTMVMRAAYGDKQMEQELKDKHGITGEIKYLFWDGSDYTTERPEGFQDVSATPVRGRE